jgi:small-conductance mechanosensitive channel
MKSDENLTSITEVLSNPLFWDAFLAVIVTGIVIVGIKNLIFAIVNYLKVLLDKNYGKGSQVIWNGEKGYIRDMGFRYIVIDTDDSIYRVPTSKWISTVIQVPKQDWQKSLGHHDE